MGTWWYENSNSTKIGLDPSRKTLSMEEKTPTMLCLAYLKWWAWRTRYLIAKCGRHSIHTPRNTCTRHTTIADPPRIASTHLDKYISVFIFWLPCCFTILMHPMKKSNGRTMGNPNRMTCTKHTRLTDTLKPTFRLLSKSWPNTRETCNKHWFTTH